MSLGNEIGTFLWEIAEQKKGFSFGKMWRSSDNALGVIIPIIRSTQVKRSYKMLEETRKVTIVDTGSISRAHVKSDDDTTVFIRSGVILAGATQERAVVSGVVIPPQSEQEVEVNCVHASRGIRSGAMYDLSNLEVTPPLVHRVLVDQSNLYEKQSHVWNSVQSYCSEATKTTVSNDSRNHQRFDTPSDDLYGTLKEIERRKSHVEDALKDIPLVRNQVGALVLDHMGVVGFEVFDSPKSWAMLHQKVLSKYSDVLMREGDASLFELKPERLPKKIQEFIEEIMKASEKQTQVTTLSSTSVIDSKTIIGEYTQISGEIIHVLAFKRQGKI